MATITQEQLDSFKAELPNDQRLQALTRPQLLSNTDDGKIDWPDLTSGQEKPVSLSAGAPLTPCQMAVGSVVFDVIALALGASAMRASASPAAIEAVGRAARPVLSQIEQVIARMAAPGATNREIATGVLDILRLIYKGGALGAVIEAFLGTLTWYEMVLYAVSATATIVLAVTTGGTAFIALVVLEVTGLGVLVNDSVKAVQACQAA
ncbi:MAG: hypothetical protein O2884_13060 [Chloroflexi bacterium]|nr:hypothetical protein [Chloroflexota bacterium]